MGLTTNATKLIQLNTTNNTTTPQNIAKCIEANNIGIPRSGMCQTLPGQVLHHSQQQHSRPVVVMEHQHQTSHYHRSRVDSRPNWHKTIVRMFSSGGGGAAAAVGSSSSTSAAS